MAATYRVRLSDGEQASLHAGDLRVLARRPHLTQNAGEHRRRQVVSRRPTARPLCRHTASAACRGHHSTARGDALSAGCRGVHRAAHRRARGFVVLSRPHSRASGAGSRCRCVFARATRFRRRSLSKRRSARYSARTADRGRRGGQRAGHTLHGRGVLRRRPGEIASRVVVGNQSTFACRGRERGNVNNRVEEFADAQRLMTFRPRPWRSRSIFRRRPPRAWHRREAHRRRAIPRPRRRHRPRARARSPRQRRRPPRCSARRPRRPPLQRRPRNWNRTGRRDRPRSRRRSLCSARRSRSRSSAMATPPPPATKKPAKARKRRPDS